MSTKRDRRDAAAATALYAALTIVFTWPLVRGLARDLPGDFGDPLLNSWILAWDAAHMFSGGRGWWNANIFHPHPLALAYSEHLAAPALQILPVYRLTGNPILAYNLLFLSTFVLSGLGMFLFARELTGNRAAAFVAGLAYAFAPYRVASMPHLQVLSSAWMPFVLYGFRRYFDTRHPLPLAGAALAWLLQNLSCGYYLLFFAPVVAMYLVWELTARGWWRDARAIAAIATACALVGIATVPFLLPYLELRSLGFTPRSLAETQGFSADVYAYFTADPNLRVWGSIAQAWPRAEGALFPGLTVVALAIVAIVGAIVARPFQGRGRDRDPKRVALQAITLQAMTCGAAAILFALLLGFSIRLPFVKITRLDRALVIAGIAAAAGLAASRDTRVRLAAWLRSPAGFFCVVVLFAIVMSFGPAIHARGRVVLESNLYALFYRFVPGFDGLRVPARFGMIVGLGLSVLVALGLDRTSRVPSLSFIAAALILLESFAVPIPLNQTSADYRRPGLAALPALERHAPPVYDFIAALPAASAIVELPLGEPAFDVRYMYYSTRHWKPLVNGYTGGQPAEYGLLDQRLQDLFIRPDRAWLELRRARATHVVVHERYYAGDLGPRVSQWLRGHGAREVAAFGADRVFEMSGH